MSFDELLYNVILGAVIYRGQYPRHWRDRKNYRVYQLMMGQRQINLQVVK